MQKLKQRKTQRESRGHTLWNRKKVNESTGKHTLPPPAIPQTTKGGEKQTG